MNEDFDNVIQELNQEVFPRTAFEFELGSALMCMLDILMPGEFVESVEEVCYCENCVNNLIAFAEEVLHRWNLKYGGHAAEFLPIDHEHDD